MSDQIESIVWATEGGHLVVKDGKSHLPTHKDGKPDHRLMGAAWAALHGGYRGNKYEGPDKQAAIEKLRKMYKSEGMEPPSEASEPDAGELVVCKDSGAPLKSKNWEKDKPVDFMWAPGGKSCITAGCAGRSLRLWVMADERSAKDVQSSFVQAVEESPRRRPFGCVEHREEERAFDPQSFTWKTSPEPGIYCSAVPTKLGAENVTGGMHSSFSPCFRHDGRISTAVCTECDESYAKCKCDGVLEFPPGVRGSESNPAHINGVHEKSVGSLTNWPAFKDILPVTAKEPPTSAAGTHEGVLKAWESRKHGFAKHMGTAMTAHMEARRLVHVDRTAAKEHAEAASEAAESSSALVPESEREDRHLAHAFAERTHREAAQANEVAGRYNESNHHHNQANLHGRYAEASKDSSHPDHKRAMVYQAKESSEFDDIIEATGTSEGVRKSWETRHKGLPTKKKIKWAGGRNSLGHISDFQHPSKNSKFQDVGTALYTALKSNGEVAWSERRPMHVEYAERAGLLTPHDVHSPKIPKPHENFEEYNQSSEPAKPSLEQLYARRAEHKPTLEEIYARGVNGQPAGRN